MNMVYTTNGKTVLSSSQQTAGEYGAATGSVSAPSGGWPVGNYQITFSGKGATKTVDFTMIDGATTTVPLPYSNTASNAAQQTRQPVGSETTQSIGSAATQSSNTGRGVIVGRDGAAYRTGSNATVQSANVWVFQDGSAVVNLSYLPGTVAENSKTGDENHCHRNFWQCYRPDIYPFRYERSVLSIAPKY